VSRRPNGSDGPEDVDAAFAEIVAELEREGLGAAVAEEEERHVERSAPEQTQDQAVWRPSDGDWDPTADDPPEVDAASVEEDHFVPPEPPPLPRLRPGTIFGMLLLVIGVVLLAAPGALGLAPRIGTPLALVSLATGIGWLMLRMRQGPPPGSGWDDGAQL
jgi:hypothetical protein